MGVFFRDFFLRAEDRAEDYQLSPKKSHFLLILLRATEIVNKPKEIDPGVLDLLNCPFVEKIEFNHKVFRK